MAYLFAVTIALISAALTFFTGFGLGTLLLAGFVLVLPVELAIAATAIVHLTNNVFKLLLVGRKAKKQVILSFGIPALLSAFAGAYLLTLVTGLAPIATYDLLDKQFAITPVKLLIGILMAFFSLVELSGLSTKLILGEQWMPLGGMLSGFFGGLSGHQGAFRTMFLLKSGLTKEQFIGTGAVIAAMVDIGRLTIYLPYLSALQESEHLVLLFAATVAAICGTLLGNQLLKKVTLKSIEIAASILLLVISLALASGLI